MNQHLSTSESNASAENMPIEGNASMPEPQQYTVQDATRTVGQRLAQLRAAKNWQISDISKHLKVPEAKLRALEAGALENLPDMTFTIGIVRSYAKMLDVDPAPFVQDLRHAHDLPKPRLALLETPGHPVKLPGNHRPFAWTVRAQRHHVWLWVGGLTLLASALFLVLVWFNKLEHGRSIERQAQQEAAARDNMPDERILTPPQNVPMPPTTDADEIPPQLPASGKTAAETEQESEAHPDPSAPPRSDEPSALAPSGLENSSAASPEDLRAALPRATEESSSNTRERASVYFKVSQTTWLSVHQNNGQQIYTGLLQAGEARTLSGAPPLDIVVGNTAGLEVLELDGQPVEPAKYRPLKDNVARFSLP